MEDVVKHIAQPVADYNVVVTLDYTTVVQLFADVVQTASVLQTMVEVAQG